MIYYHFIFRFTSTILLGRSVCLSLIPRGFYSVQEMEPPETLMCDLRPYQKQALYWMSELEKGVDVEKAGKTLHPCWAAYRICDGYAVSPAMNVQKREQS